MIVTPKPREQTRARYPGRGGFRRARRRSGLLGALRRRRARRSCFSRRGRSPLAAAGRCRSRISRATVRVVTFDPRGNGRSDRPDAAEAYSTRSSWPDAAAVLDAAGSSGHVVVGLWRRRAAEALMLAAEHPRAGQRRRGVHRAGAPGGATVARGRAVSVRRASSTRTRAGRRKTATTGYATGAAYVEFFISSSVHGAALDEADRGLRRLGARDGRRDPARQLSRLGHQGARPGDDGQSSVRASAARCSSSTGPKTSSSSLQRARAFASPSWARPRARSRARVTARTPATP